MQKQNTAPHLKGAKKPKPLDQWMKFATKMVDAHLAEKKKTAPKPRPKWLISTVQMDGDYLESRYDNGVKEISITNEQLDHECSIGLLFTDPVLAEVTFGKQVINLHGSCIVFSGFWDEKKEAIIPFTITKESLGKHIVFHVCRVKDDKVFTNTGIKDSRHVYDIQENKKSKGELLFAVVMKFILKE